MQEMQETVIILVVRKFPELEALARERVTAIDSWEHLPQVIRGLTFLHTREDVEQFLLRLPGDQLKGKRRGSRRYRVSAFDPTDPLYEWLGVDAFAKGFSQSLQQRIQAGTLEVQQAIQDSVEIGVELGIQRGTQVLQAAAIDVVESEFPELLSLAVRSITAVDDLQRLQQMVLDLSTLSSQEEAKQFLLSLFADSLYYKELLEKGVQEVIHATRQAAITAVVKRFPCSLRFPQDSKTAVGDSQHSQESILDLRYLPSPEEVERLLLSRLEEPCYSKLSEDDVQKLAQSVRQAVMDCAESLQKEVQEDASEVQKTIQKAVQQGDELGSPLGEQILQQTACALVALHFPKLESLAQEKITATDRMSDLRDLIWNLSIISDQERAKQLLSE